MKSFLCAALLAVAAADQTHHQVIKQGNAPAVSHSVHKPHGAVHASVVSQPHASPQSVHGYGTFEKPSAGVHHPAALPVKTGYAPAPVVHHAPSYHAPAPAYHAPVVHHAAPAYHAPAPAYHAPAPAYHAPVVHAAPAYHAPAVVKVAAPAYHAPAPAYHAPVVHAAPAYHAPAVVKVAHAAPAYHAPAHAPAYKEEPEPYTYEYAVADDYSKAAFNAAETADPSGNVSGSYSVALPDGRTQHVKYTADHYNGYVAEVSYEGVPVYPEAPAYKPAPAPYHAPAPAYKPAPAPAYHA